MGRGPELPGDARAPSSAETGMISPEKPIVGNLARIAPAKTAVTCVRAVAATIRPKPVAAQAWTTAASVSAARLPSSGTPGTRATRAVVSAQFASATPRWTICLRTGNSDLVVGVTRRTVIVPISVSRATETAMRIAGNRISSIGGIERPMA